MKTIRSLFDQAAQRLMPLYGKEESRRVTFWLFEKLTDYRNAQLFISLDSKVTDEQYAVFETWITQLVDDSYPLQYLLGTVQFGSLQLFIEPPVLIPRPETEEWVARIITSLKPFENQKLQILDMCTGSGCIGLWLAHEFPNFQIDLVDNHPAALALTTKNRDALKLANARIINSDLFANVTSMSYDLIVSNPPYISETEFGTLSPTVKDWESKQALVASENGLKFYRLLVQEAGEFIHKKSPLPPSIPQLVLEIGATQKKPVQMLLELNNWALIEAQQDFAGKDRVLCARLK